MEIINKRWFFECLDTYVSSMTTPVDFSKYINTNFDVGLDMYKFMNKKVMDSYIHDTPDKLKDLKNQTNALLSEYLESKRKF